MVDRHLGQRGVRDRSRLCQERQQGLYTVLQAIEEVNKKLNSSLFRRVIGSKVVTTVEPFDGEYWMAEVRMLSCSCRRCLHQRVSPMPYGIPQVLALRSKRVECAAGLPSAVPREGRSECSKGCVDGGSSQPVSPS